MSLGWILLIAGSALWLWHCVSWLVFSLFAASGIGYEAWYRTVGGGSLGTVTCPEDTQNNLHGLGILMVWDRYLSCPSLKNELSWL